MKYNYIDERLKNEKPGYAFYMVAGKMIETKLTELADKYGKFETDQLIKYGSMVTLNHVFSTKRHFFSGNKGKFNCGNDDD